MEASPAAPLQKDKEWDQPSSLMLATIKLVKERGVIKVHDETGISFYWLRRFVSMDFNNPSVNRVQYLYEYLTGKNLV